MPDIINNIIKIVYDGAKPKKLILKAVRAGEIMTKYLASVLCAKSPKNGFISDGIFLAISKNATKYRGIESFSISSGKIGAKKDE
jgi:hypothetical protein